ncbi:MAG: site-specific integrase [Bacillota bacterium]
MSTSCSRRTGQDWGERQIGEIVRQSCLRAGSSVVSPHVLQHTFATMALSSLVSLLTVKKLFGHASISTTAGYLHTARQEMEPAVNDVAELIALRTCGAERGCSPCCLL